MFSFSDMCFALHLGLQFCFECSCRNLWGFYYQGRSDIILVGQYVIICGMLALNTHGTTQKDLTSLPLALSRVLRGIFFLFDLLGCIQPLTTSDHILAMLFNSLVDSLPKAQLYESWSTPVPNCGQLSENWLSLLNPSS